MTRGHVPRLEVRLAKARQMMAAGSFDSGVEELRQAIMDATRLPHGEGRKRVEDVLRFARENGALQEVEDLLESEGLLSQFFGPDWM